MKKIIALIIISLVGGGICFYATPTSLQTQLESAVFERNHLGVVNIVAQIAGLPPIQDIDQILDLYEKVESDPLIFKKVQNFLNIDAKGLNPLMIATLKGDVDMAELLLDLGADINYQESVTGDTAYHKAIRNKRLFHVAMLFKMRKASETIKNKSQVSVRDILYAMID